MFYQILIELCQKNGTKPTSLLKELGYSAGNIKRWKEGATVNSDILISLANYFHVSIDYLLLGKENIRQIQPELTKDEQKILNYYQRLEEENKDYIIGEMVKLYKEEKNSPLHTLQREIVNQ